MGLPSSAPLPARPILIDSREGSCELADLPPLRSISQLAHLRSGDRQLGDVMIYGRNDDGTMRRVIAEVKSLGDFISSMPRNGGRIARQVVHVLGEDGGKPLADEYHLAVYGTWACGEDGSLLVPIDECPYPSHRDPNGLTPYRTSPDRNPIRYDEVESTLLTLSRAGVQRAPYLPSLLQVARWIALLAKHVARPPSKHQTLRTLPDRGMRTFLPPAVDPVTRRMVGVLSELCDGVGGKTAMVLASKWRSVGHMINADEEEWRVPRLVGGTMSKRIMRAIWEERKVGR